MLNKIILMGKLTKNGEVKEVKPGMKMLRFTLLVEHSYKTKDGQERTEKCYLDATCWNPGIIAEGAHKFIEGADVFVEGRLKSEKWEDKESGKERYRHIVDVSSLEFCSFHKDEDPTPTKPVPRAFNANDLFRDDLPF